MSRTVISRSNRAQFPHRAVWSILAAAAAVALPLRAATFDRDGAYLDLNSRVQVNHAAFFVYRNADSAFNHGSPNATSAKVHVDAACIDDFASSTGCSEDRGRLDRLRGNVLRVAFDALASGQTAALSFEEPEKWSIQESGKGFDLTGATSIAFDVRSPSPGGIDVQFGVGGRMSGVIHIPQSDSFEAMTIPLASLAPGEPPLQDVHVLFTVATDGEHAPGGGTILLDDIRFLPTPPSRLGAVGFPLANETFGVVPATMPLEGRVPIPIDQALRNAGTIYDSAMTMMALLDRGTAEDRANAEEIADAFHYALHNDPAAQYDRARSPGRAASFGLPTIAVSIRNGYRAGDLKFLNDDSSGAKADTPRPAGFTASSDLCGAGSYCVVLDGATGRNVGFAILALVAAHESLGNPEYLDDAALLGGWIVNELADPSAKGFGGYDSGYADRQDPKLLVKTKSVADNAVIYAALSRLATAERNWHIGASGFSRWSEPAAFAGDFVMQMYDPESGRFFAGTVPVDTPPGFGIAPDGASLGGEVVNTYASPEANALAVLALAGRYRGAIDWRGPLEWLVGSKVTVSAADSTFSGFGIDTEDALGPAGIAWDVTAQTVAAMRLVDCLYGGDFGSDVAYYSDQLAHAQASAPFGDGQGVVASTLMDGDALPPVEQCLSTPDGCVPERVNLAATAWSLFADQAHNPLSTSAGFALCPAGRRRAVR